MSVFFRLKKESIRTSTARYLYHSSSNHRTAPQHYGKWNRRGLISTALSASLTMALINDIQPPKAPPVRITIKMIICWAAAAFDYTHRQRKNRKVKRRGGLIHAPGRHQYCKYCDFLISNFGGGAGRANSRRVQ